MSAGSSSPAHSAEALEGSAIRSFHFKASEEALGDLRRRINAANWPERETVTDASQGVQLATMQALARYWATDYDWRKCEARLNALPQFMTKIDGLDIHFIHVRSNHQNALPLIVTHGWPGSIVEQLKMIDPLTNPTAHGGSASDAFDIVIPSMPGYGFSGRPTKTGWDPAHIASAWVELMKRLGYKHLWRKAAIGARSLSSTWVFRRRRNCLAFTPTWQRDSSLTSTRRLFRARRRQQVSRPTRSSLTSG